MIGVSIYSINSTIAESTELPDPSYSDNVRGDRNHQKHEVPQIQEMVQMQTLPLFM